MLRLVNRTPPFCWACGLQTVGSSADFAEPQRIDRGDGWDTVFEDDGVQAQVLEGRVPPLQIVQLVAAGLLLLQFVGELRVLSDLNRGQEGPTETAAPFREAATAIG